MLLRQYQLKNAKQLFTMFDFYNAYPMKVGKETLFGE
jgi:hypothetical protein